MRRAFAYDESVTVARFVHSGAPWRALGEQVVWNNHPMLSVVDSIVASGFGTGEVAMRVAPITAAFLAAVLLFDAVARRWGARAASVAMLVYATSPLTLVGSREARGYAFLTLGIVVAMRAAPALGRSRRATAVYIAAVAFATASQLLMIPIVWVISQAGRDRDDRHRRLVAGAIGALVGACAYAFIAVAMLKNRPPGGYDVHFFGQLASKSTGGTLLASVLFVAGCVVGLRRASIDWSRVWRPVTWTLALVAVMWISGSNPQLRFFGWVVPGIALVAAVAVARSKVATVLIGAALVISVVHQWPDLDRDAFANREIAAQFQQVQREHGRPCLFGAVEIMPVYFERFTTVEHASQLAQCSVAATLIPGQRSDLLRAATRHWELEVPFSTPLQQGILLCTRRDDLAPCRHQAQVIDALRFLGRKHPH
jgi:4-amino-4-deoxy-L-arabinose transferase-like glycosyltransferase